MIGEKEKTRKLELTCPLWESASVSVPLIIEEAGIDLCCTENADHAEMMRGKFFRIFGNQSHPHLTKVSAENLSLDKEIAPVPNFGFRPGKVIWVSAQAVENYGPEGVYQILRYLLITKKLA